VLGSLVACGYPLATLSLDLVAFEEVCRSLALFWEESRKLSAERRYQLMLELRAITWYIAQRNGNRIGLDRVPSGPLVEALVLNVRKERSAHNKAREKATTLDPEAWLSESEQEKLTTDINAFFQSTKQKCLVNKDHMSSSLSSSSLSLSSLSASTDVEVSADTAWRFQGHLLLHLLNDNVVPVPRSQLLGTLCNGSTCVFDEKLEQWTFVGGASTEHKHDEKKKESRALIIRVPESSTWIMNTWMSLYRPALVGVVFSFFFPRSCFRLFFMYAFVLFRKFNTTTSL
jgi:hypothetical protein